MPAYADPPSHAPAYGYRDKQEKRPSKHVWQGERRDRGDYDKWDKEGAKRQEERGWEWDKRRDEAERERDKREAERRREWQKRQAELARERDKREAERDRERGSRYGRDVDRFPSTASARYPRAAGDLDRDGIADTRDQDRDNDGILNTHDRYPSDPPCR